MFSNFTRLYRKVLRVKSQLLILKKILRLYTTNDMNLKHN
jgi:hypothetical protein